MFFYKNVIRYFLQQKWNFIEVKYLESSFYELLVQCFSHNQTCKLRLRHAHTYKHIDIDRYIHERGPFLTIKRFPFFVNEEVIAGLVAHTCDPSTQEDHEFDTLSQKTKQNKKQSNKQKM
jgi:hypothetical protein